MKEYDKYMKFNGQTVIWITIDDIVSIFNIKYYYYYYIIRVYVGWIDYKKQLHWFFNR